MKTRVGQKGNKDIPIKSVSNPKVVDCIRDDISCNTGKVVYVANEDGTQGLMSKVSEDGKMLIPVNGRWVEV